MCSAPAVKGDTYYGLDRSDLADLILKTCTTRHARALDIGCGEGMLGDRLLREGYEEVWGVEPVAPVASAARARLTGVTCGTFPECIDELPGSFDLVIMADSLEHMAYPEVALEAVHAVLRPEGMLALSVPNVSHYSIIGALLRGEWTYTDAGLLDRTHLRFFTPSSLAAALRATGWLAVASRDNKLTLRRQHLLLTWLLRSVMPHTLVFQMLVVARDAHTGTE